MRCEFCERRMPFAWLLFVRVPAYPHGIHMHCLRRLKKDWEYKW